MMISTWLCRFKLGGRIPYFGPCADLLHVGLLKHPDNFLDKKNSNSYFIVFLLNADG